MGNSAKNLEISNEKLIDDKRFAKGIRTISRVVETIRFERIDCEPNREEVDIALLNALLMARKKGEGRPPTVEEWKELNHKLNTLMPHLTPQQLKKIQLRQITGFLLWLPISLLVFSAIALIAALTLNALEAKFIFFVFWVIATGALGSVAFIYVNALSIQVDPTVDIVSPHFVMLRLVLGALFAIILTLPFGFPTFQNFSTNLLIEKPVPTSITDSMMLLLPFLLGFSTPLVLSILHRMVQSAQTFFGVQEPERALSPQQTQVPTPR